MSDSTHNRRGFLLGAGTVGIAAAGVVGAGSASASPRPEAPVAVDPAAAAAAGPITFYLKDAARGQIAILTGEREVVITDRAAVARLITAAGR